MKTKVKVLTPEERRRLIESPISIHTYGHGRSWSGTGVLSDNGRTRIYTPAPANTGMFRIWGGLNHE